MRSLSLGTADKVKRDKLWYHCLCCMWFQRSITAVLSRDSDRCSIFCFPVILVLLCFTLASCCVKRFPAGSTCHTDGSTFVSTLLWHAEEVTVDSMTLRNQDPEAQIMSPPPLCLEVREKSLYLFLTEDGAGGFFVQVFLNSSCPDFGRIQTSSFFRQKSFSRKFNTGSCKIFNFSNI